MSVQQKASHNSFTEISGLAQAMSPENIRVSGFSYTHFITRKDAKSLMSVLLETSKGDLFGDHFLKDCKWVLNAMWPCKMQSGACTLLRAAHAKILVPAFALVHVEGL